MLSGTRLWISQRCSVACSRSNMGKALKMARATVNSGTSEMVVVKVRLLAVMPRRSSRKRSRSVSAVVCQGKSSTPRQKRRANSDRASSRSDKVIPVSCQPPFSGPSACPTPLQIRPTRLKRPRAWP